MLAKYNIANTLRIISEPKNGITIIPNPTGSGKSYETAIFIAWMLMNSERKIIFVTTRIAHLNRIENDIAYHLKQMGEHDKIEKIVQIKSFVNCIKQSFLKLSDDIEKVANRNSELKEVFTVLRSELIRLNIETNNAKNNQDSNKAIIKSINDHISNLEPKFRWLLSKEFAQSYKYNKYDENGYRVSSYDYMMNSEEWKFISELYPSSQHSQKQVFIMTSAKFLEKDDPIISERYDFIKGEHLKDAIVIIDEVDAVKEDFLRKILSNDLKKNIVDTFKVIYRTFENVDEMDPDTIEVSKSIGKIKAISNRSKEIKEKYFPSKWVVKLFEKDENGELQEANIIDKLMNFYSVDNYFDTNRKYVYIPFTDDREDPDNMTQCNIIISENDLDDDIKPKITIMLTSYLSVSRGNNLQINIGKDEVRNRLDAGDLLPVNDWPTSGDVDWDSIYMEKPSHVIPDLKNDLSSLDENNDIITGRLKLFLTVEELFARGDINKHKKNDILKEVFDYLESGYSEKLNARLKDYNDIYRLFSVKADYTTIVYQTMGRIVRTSVKKPCNAIFYDVDMLEHIITDTDKLNLPIITNEFDRFLSHVKKEVTSIFKSALENSNLEFRRKNRDVYLAINDILTAGNGDFGWDKDLQQLWEFLRETVLKYPVISKKELKKYRKNITL